MTNNEVRLFLAAYVKELSKRNCIKFLDDFLVPDYRMFCKAQGLSKKDVAEYVRKYRERMIAGL